MNAQSAGSGSESIRALLARRLRSHARSERQPRLPAVGGVAVLRAAVELARRGGDGEERAGTALRPCA